MCNCKSGGCHSLKASFGRLTLLRSQWPKLYEGQLLQVNLIALKTRAQQIY